MVQENAPSGTSQIQLDGVTRQLWTLSSFLSRRPIADVYGELESPFEAGTTLNEPVETSETPQQLTPLSMSNPTEFSGK